jgi:hypothetical protein
MIAASAAIDLGIAGSRNATSRIACVTVLEMLALREILREAGLF